MLSGLWKAVRPPPGLLIAAFSTARLVSGWCYCSSCYLCCRGDSGRRHEGRPRKDEVKAALKRLGSGGLGVGAGQGLKSKSMSNATAKAKAGVRDRDKGRLAAVAKSEYFWCFKVCRYKNLPSVRTHPALASANLGRVF